MTGVQTCALPICNLFNQSLPLDPAGVVYDSITRLPVAGATVTITGPAGFNPATDLVASGTYTLGVNSASMPSAALGAPLPGAYQFLLNPTAPAGVYTLTVTAPNYVAFPAGTPTPTSTIIPFSTTVPTGVPFGVLGGTVTAGGVYTPQMGNGVESMNAQNYYGNPPPNGTIDTNYYLRFNLSPGTGNGVVNNHIPLDPIAMPKLLITKVGDRATAELGDSVRYTIRVKRVDTGTYTIPTSQVIDSLPAGFRFIDGTAQISLNGATAVTIADPSGKPGPVLRFTTGPIPANQEIILTYRVRLGAGAMQGTGINRAQATAGLNVNCANPSTGQLCSNEAQYRVKVTGGVFTNQACIIGKVYVDCNNNQVQDEEELGIPGVRMYLENGTSITTDVEGKYNYCGLDPKTHNLVVDQTTLPRGARLVTSSSRNAGDAASLFLDLKNGDMFRADFIEGSCSNTVLEQVKARRSRGEVNGVDTEKPVNKGGVLLKFDGKPAAFAQQGTDSANQTGNANGLGEVGSVKPRIDGGKIANGQVDGQMNGQSGADTGETIQSPVYPSPPASGQTLPAGQGSAGVSNGWANSSVTNATLRNDTANRVEPGATPAATPTISPVAK